MSAWIEIAKTNAEKIEAEVALLASAWIEIQQIKRAREPILSRTPSECVD